MKYLLLTLCKSYNYSYKLNNTAFTLVLSGVIITYFLNKAFIAIINEVYELVMLLLAFLSLQTLLLLYLL